MKYKTLTQYNETGLAEDETLLLSLEEYRNGDFKGVKLCITKDGSEPTSDECGII